MSSIFSGQFGKNTTDQQIAAYKAHKDRALKSKYNYVEKYKNVDISKILKDKVPLSNGGVLNICPAAIADDIKMMLDDMRRDPKYEFIKPYIQKPVIWTYEIATALTDGIRIYMSPVFAAVLLDSTPKRRMGGAEADEWFNSLSFQEQRDSKNRLKLRMMRTKYVRFTIVHEVYHILYNHVRRGILKYGSNPTEQEHEVGNISMDLEINRDIESTFPDLRGSTQKINAIWYENEKFFNKKGQPFVKDIWEDIWDDFMARGKNFKTSDPFANEGANPVQADNAKQGPYADGWRKAVDAIKGKLIDPKSFDLSNIPDSTSDQSLEDALNKILNDEKQSMNLGDALHKLFNDKNKD